jgi:hypothetical protein
VRYGTEIAKNPEFSPSPLRIFLEPLLALAVDDRALGVEHPRIEGSGGELPRSPKFARG